MPEWSMSGSAQYTFPLHGLLRGRDAGELVPRFSFTYKDRTFLDLFKDGAETKPKQLEPILDALPKRQFLLVGDSGENGHRGRQIQRRDRTGHGQDAQR